MKNTSAKTGSNMERVEKEPLLSAKNKKLLRNPLGIENPITVQVLGICSALAVTVKMKPAIVMALSVTIVVALSNLIIALMRKSIPGRIRIIVQLVVIATLVIMVDQFLKAFAFDVSKQLSVFVGLIITNCILMGRLEAFAMGNDPWPSFLDGIGNGAGYGMILIIVSFFREFLGSGSIMGFPVMEKLGIYKFGYEDNGMMILPPMALITVGLIIWFQRSRNKSLIETK
jgi:Na+-transporting NADH:ubiquinone oxidoreductase subunit D